jgi:hypothetical protein
MHRFIFTSIFVMMSLNSMVFGSAREFGYIAYSTFNIGDDVQALAAKQFLPGTPIGIDREFVGVFEYPYPIPVLVNGWFMHTKDFCWYRPDVPAPTKSWPPSPCMEPLFISLHLAEGFIPHAFTDEAVNYLKAHGPIGARDLNTLQELQARGIDSYFSGCLSLTLKNDSDTRGDIIYAVDLDDECYRNLRSRVSGPIERTTHMIDSHTALNPELRLQYTLNLLEKYKRAKAVVTVRLHATMPCLAFETPVLLIVSKDDKRYFGLRELTHNCTRKEFLNGQFDFDFDQPSENPPQYLELRRNLIEIVENWMEKYQVH